MKWFKYDVAGWAAAVQGLSMLEEGALVRLARWCFQHEKPLPLSMGEIRKIAGAANQHERTAIERVVDLFFAIDEDGRRMALIDGELVRVRRALGMSRDGEKASPDMLQHDVTALPRGRSRQTMLRHRRAEMFNRLSELGVHPGYETGTQELRRLCAERHVTLSSDASSDGSLYGLRAIAKNKEELKSALPSVERRARAPSVPAPPSPETPAPAPDPLPEIPPFPPRRSPAVEAAMAMRAAGMADVNPSHPDLLRLAGTGLPPEHFGDAAKEAVSRKKGFAYTLALIDGRLRDSAASRPLPGHVSLMEKWAPGLAASKSGVFGPGSDPGEGVPPDAPPRRLGHGS